MLETPSFERPPKCRDCMALREVAANIALNRAMRDEEIARAIALMRFADREQKLYPTGAQEDPAPTRSYLTKMCQEAGNALTEHDDMEDEYYRARAELVETCDGVAWAQVSIAGSPFLIGVCTAPGLYEPNNGQLANFVAAIRVKINRPTDVEI